MKQVMRKWAMPDAFLIIFGIVVLAAVATYILPAGQYEREEIDGVTKVVPNSYEAIESAPATLMDVFAAVPKGLVASSTIIFLIFIIGGIVALVESTGAIDQGVHVLIDKAKGNYMLLIAVVSGIFGLLASMGIAANAVIAFIPIGIALARSLKLDAIVGVATVYLGYYCGMIAGIFDPTILGLAQTLAELPLFSGMWLRIILFFVLITVTILYINRYAKKVHLHPDASYMGSERFTTEEQSEVPVGTKFTLRQGLVLLAFLGGIIIFIIGAFQKDWGITELSAIFLMVGVVIGIIAQIPPNLWVKRFIRGAEAIAYGALVVGVARAVIVILEDGMILDTVVYSALIPLESMSLHVGAQLLFVFNLLFNFLVTSGTGQAAIVMPVMVPIVDLLGITRQTGALILMLGDGFTNIVAPTSGVLMAVLAIGGVKWTTWIRFAFPLLCLWIVIGSIFIFIATSIQYGPF
ncbi:YfcC family protein [Planococcaceae bacterium Storch 2/2-2]|nr:YfcC family protein [Planococcaceae bacterium Storch 2/2-2]